VGVTADRRQGNRRCTPQERGTLKLLFVAPPGLSPSNAYTMRWRRRMNLLIVSKLARSARAINTIDHYCRVAPELGHQVAVFGEQQFDFPDIPFSLDVARFDVAVFVVYMSSDFPDLPYLANLLDSVPKSRRVIIDCSGRYNDTVRVEHDFNHLEKMDGHQGWEWIEAFQSVADRILQPTLTPRRDDVRSFLFHGYDPAEVAVPPPASAAEARRGWSREAKRYGIAYVGHNWQRWSQIRRFLEAIAPIRDELGSLALVGWDWRRRPDWAVQLGIKGADVDPELLQRLGVEMHDPIPFTEVSRFLSKARFSPIFQRPLFNELGLVTNRTFETFHADTVPLVMLPEGLAAAIYGPAVHPLVPGDDIAGWLRQIMHDPEPCWDAILRVRQYLAAHHSYRQRLSELVALVER
jgi:hypothetical protein